MDMKKILICFIVLIAVVASVAALSATEINLPDGYKMDDSKAVVNKTTDFMGVKAILNKYVMVSGDKNITVDTFLPEQEVTLNPSGNSQMKTIGGVEGIYQEKDGRFIFVYSSDKQFVQIDAPEEKLIEQVISK